MCALVLVSMVIRPGGFCWFSFARFNGDTPFDWAILGPFLVSGEKAGSMPEVSNPSWLVRIGDISDLSWYPVPFSILLKVLFGVLFYSAVELL